MFVLVFEDEEFGDLNDQADLPGLSISAVDSLSAEGTVLCRTKRMTLGLFALSCRHLNVSPSRVKVYEFEAIFPYRSGSERCVPPTAAGITISLDELYRWSFVAIAMGEDPCSVVE